MIDRSALPLFVVALAGCASAPPAEPAAPVTTAAPSAAPAAAPAPEAPPSAKVIAVEPGKESAPSARAKIVFENPTKRACRFLGYKMTWAGASKAIKLETLSIPPGETRERWLKVNAGDGDLAALTPAAARVEVETECGAP